MIAFLALQLEGQTIALVPILACSFVIINLLFAIAHRQMMRRGLSRTVQVGIGHTLLDLGLRTPVVLSCLYLLAGLIGAISYLTNRVSSMTGLVLFGLVSMILFVNILILLRKSMHRYDRTINCHLTEYERS